MRLRMMTHALTTVFFTQAFVTHQEQAYDNFLGLDSFSGPVANEQPMFRQVPVVSTRLAAVSLPPAAASAGKMGWRWFLVLSTQGNH